MRNRFIIFLLVSIFLHFILLYFSKPNLLLFSSIQNLKIKKKKELTKVKFIKIKPKPKPKPKSKPKPKPKLKKTKTNQKPKIKKKQKLKTKYKKKLKNKKSKTKTSKAKAKTINKKKIKSKITNKKKIKKEKLDLSIIQKKVAMLKKKEKEKEIKEELKKEAAIFYANRLVSLVQRLWIFPKVIPDSELPNLKIKIKLRVRKDGTIIGEPEIISKSNNKIFNESALRAVKKLYKYKIPLPDIIDDNYIDIILTLTPPEH